MDKEEVEHTGCSMETSWVRGRTVLGHSITGRGKHLLEDELLALDSYLSLVAGLLSLGKLWCAKGLTEVAL